MKSSQVYTGAETLENMSQAAFYNQWSFRKFKKYLKGEILEVGCGIGNFTEILSHYGKVTAIDIDESLIDKFKSKKDSNIEAGYGDIEGDKYFFKKKQFDTIVCINVLEHIENDSQALENMYKLLKKDGNLILLVPIYDFLYGEIDRAIGHFRRYSPNILPQMIEKLGNKIIFLRKLNFIGALGWFISGRILKNKKVTGNKIRAFNLISPILYLENVVEPPIGTSILIVAKKE